MDRVDDNLTVRQLRTRLDGVHRFFLTIHKAILDHELMGYERKHGHIDTPGQAFHLAINDSWFEWLRTLSGLITQIDEFTSSRDPFDAGRAHALIRQSRQMMMPDQSGNPFQREYARVIQESPEIASPHGEWKGLLRSFSGVAGTGS